MAGLSLPRPDRHSVPPMDVAALKPFVRELAAESGALIKRYFRSPGLTVDIKDDATPVTDADRGAEELLRKRILARFPDHGIMAEEFGTERGDAEWVWALDPIDGTKSFVSGVPLFGTLIALLHHGQPVLGAIHQPILDELCLGDGTTTTLNDRPVRVRTTTRLQDAVVLASDTTTAARHQSAAGWERLVASARWVRTWGDCYGYLLVAAGRAEVMTDAIVNDWDTAAVQRCIVEAGGIFTDWDGNETAFGGSAIATNAGVAAEARALLR